MVNQEILNQVRRIELTSKRLMDSALSGAYHSRFKGKGMEFAEVREYVAGDDIRSIDWNVTARSQSPHVKQFDEERELNLMLVVDCSASTHFGSQFSLKRESMAMVAGLLAFAAVQNQDQVGLLLFSDHVEKVIPPAKGRKHVLRLIRDLLEFEPQGKATSIHSALEGLRQNLKKHSLVAFLSDFLQMDHLDDLKHLNRKHEVLAVQFWDPFEGVIPKVGKFPLQDLETGEIHWLDSSHRSLRQNLEKFEETEAFRLEQFFKKRKVDFIRVTQKSDFESTIQPLVQYFYQRKKGGRR